MKTWCVVWYTRRGPLWVDGPYRSRAVAQEVRRHVLEENDGLIRGRVVEMFYLVPPRDVEREFGVKVL